MDLDPSGVRSRNAQVLEETGDVYEMVVPDGVAIPVILRPEKAETVGCRTVLDYCIGYGKSHDVSVKSGLNVIVINPFSPAGSKA